MASYKMNFAICKGLQDPAAIVAGMEEYGLAESEEMGVLHASAAAGAAFGTLVRRTNLAIQKLDLESREVVTDTVERVSLIAFGAFPAEERLEVYGGSASAIADVSTFLGSCLGQAIVTDPYELDMEAAVEKVMNNTQRFMLRTIRVTDYAADSYMIGPYAPKFLDTEHGLKFLEDFGEAVKSVQVRFAAPTAKANVTLAPNACFSYSCHEDDQPVVQQLLRGLL